MPFLGVMEEEILRLILRLKDQIYFSQIYDERRFSNKLENKTGTLILQDRTRVLYSTANDP